MNPPKNRNREQAGTNRNRWIFFSAGEQGSNDWLSENCRKSGWGVLISTQQPPIGQPVQQLLGRRSSPRVKTGSASHERANGLVPGVLMILVEGRDRLQSFETPADSAHHLAKQPHRTRSTSRRVADSGRCVRRATSSDEFGFERALPAHLDRAIESRKAVALTIAQSARWRGGVGDYVLGEEARRRHHLPANSRTRRTPLVTHERDDRLWHVQLPVAGVLPPTGIPGARRVAGIPLRADPLLPLEAGGRGGWKLTEEQPRHVLTA
jgi:hypothetical protein